MYQGQGQRLKFVHSPYFLCLVHYTATWTDFKKKIDLHIYHRSICLRYESYIQPKGEGQSTGASVYKEHISS